MHEWNDCAVWILSGLYSIHAIYLSIWNVGESIYLLGETAGRTCEKISNARQCILTSGRSHPFLVSELVCKYSAERKNHAGKLHVYRGRRCQCCYVQYKHLLSWPEFPYCGIVDSFHPYIYFEQSSTFILCFQRRDVICVYKVPF